MGAQCKRNACSFGVCEALVVSRDELLHQVPTMNKCHSKVLEHTHSAGYHVHGA